jgi:hypothetical protein
MLSQSQYHQLASLEAAALTQLREVDLCIPMQQIRRGLEALLDIPTTARTANTIFSQQALTAITMLADEVEELSAAVQSLMEHVGRTAPVRVQPPWLYPQWANSVSTALAAAALPLRVRSAPANLGTSSPAGPIDRI